MTIFVSTTKIAPAPRRCSSLVLRLIKAKNDPVKHRLRAYLLTQTDERVRESLGFSELDIRALRSGLFSPTKD